MSIINTINLNSNKSLALNSGSSTVAYIPKHRRDLLDLLYSANHLLDEIWKETAEFERNEKNAKAHKQKAISHNIHQLKNIQHSLEQNLNGHSLVHNHWTQDSAELHLAYGKCQYLKAKMYEFQDRDPKIIEQTYRKAEKNFITAGNIFKTIKDVHGEIISTEYLSIVEDQFCKTCQQSNKEHNPEIVINTLKSLVKKLDLNHKSYHVGFEITAHILSLVFAPIIGAIEFALIGLIRGNNNIDKHKEIKPNETKFKTKIHEMKAHLSHGFSELLPLALGYISAFVVLETFIKQNLATFLLHQIPLASLPTPLANFGIWILKVLYDSDELRELFIMKANIHHDLMKGYDNLVKLHNDQGNYATQKNFKNAERNEKISKFFYEQYIKMLDPIVDAQEISDIQEYMQR